MKMAGPQQLRGDQKRRHQKRRSTRALPECAQSKLHREVIEGLADEPNRSNLTTTVPVLRTLVKHDWARHKASCRPMPFQFGPPKKRDA
jgi:hypothetical protein